jgi:AraC family transcriptional activator of pobA
VAGALTRLVLLQVSLTLLASNFNKFIMNDNVFELINPQSKSLAIKVHSFESDEYFSDLNKYNYFSVILVLAGTGSIVADISEYTFNKNSLICFSLYQPFKIRSEGKFKGLMINFHPEFFCLHKHRNEVSCNGVLFNNIYESPVIDLTPDETQLLLTTMVALRSEMQRPGISQLELLLSYLKILLINASRIKIGWRNQEEPPTGKKPDMLNNLKDAIEKHFKSLHSPGDYAGLLNISTAALNRVSKVHFNKTLSNLIADRIIIEAKRQLYLTSKPIKLIAYELGFNDEFYFSRFFKSHVAISPQFFRDTVGFDRANA